MAGGVIIGASSGLLTNSGASLIIGGFGGVISSLSFSYLHDFMRDKINVHDTAGVHNLHGIPGICGGLISAAVIASYNSDPLNNPSQRSYLGFYDNLPFGRTFVEQGAIQLAGTGVSLGLGLLFGILTGFIIRFFYTTYLPT